MIVGVGKIIGECPKHKLRQFSKIIKIIKAITHFIGGLYSSQSNPTSPALGPGSQGNECPLGTMVLINKAI